MSDDAMILTTDPVDLPGVEPADPPTELVPGRLWHGGCPVDFDWVHDTGIDLVLDLADADAHPNWSPASSARATRRWSTAPSGATARG